MHFCTKVFARLNNLLPSVAVEFVVVDYEMAAWKAFREVFHNVKIQGCYFHYAQAVWRNIQAQGKRSCLCCNLCSINIKRVIL